MGVGGSLDVGLVRLVQGLALLASSPGGAGAIPTGVRANQNRKPLSTVKLDASPPSFNSA